jgi:hypothetical protein
MIEPTIKTESLTVYHGDAFEVIQQLRGGHVDCIITGPPLTLLSIVKRFAGKIKPFTFGNVVVRKAMDRRDYFSAVRIGNCLESCFLSLILSPLRLQKANLFNYFSLPFLYTQERLCRT